jgi:phosphoribosyl 1,2-cyclic phosphodiesterase
VRLRFLGTRGEIEVRTQRHRRHSSLLVGYRVTAGRAAIFYAPDLVSIVDEKEALSGLDLYVGDGAAVTRSIVRRRDGRAIGHASIQAQLERCACAGVRRAVFTHCGSEIVKGDARTTAAEVRTLGRERGIDARIAHDGLELALPTPGSATTSYG